VLLGVPNISEGRDAARISALEAAFSRGAILLDRHSDADHNRTVFTLAGGPGPLRDALVSGAEEAIETIDMTGHRGAHPAIGALDVCPLVRLDPAERAHFRNGGLPELWLRMEAGELRPDRGPDRPHRTAGATLLTARPPLAAFNVELDSGDVEVACAVAAGLRESGGGPRGVRAIGLPLSSGRAQVSTNVHDPLEVPLATVVERVRALAAPLGARPVEAELIGLIPAAALAGYPEDVPIRGFDPDRHVIERRLAPPTD
jgi:glutamate formiminotransferase